MRWQLAAVAALALGACNAIGGIYDAQPACPDDNRKNGRETDVDCGGGCGKCENGKHCVMHEDCVDNACYGGVCTPADCEDDRKNGTETDVDCGGDNSDCDRCYGGYACLHADDCTSFPDRGNAACTDGFCVSACCADDCEVGCGCVDPEEPDPPSCCTKACDPGELASTCDAEIVESCEYPLNCYETDGPESKCY